MAIKCPCKGCDDRYLTCHDHCSLYAEYKAKLKFIQDQKAKENDEIAFNRTIMKKVRKEK